jgi:WD40 repeat protein
MAQLSAIAREWNLNVPVSALALNRNGNWVAAALGDGTLRLFPAHAEAEKPREMEAHKGVSLSLQSDADGQGFLSGGDDGKVLLIDPVMAAPTVLAEHAHKWIDHVASSSEGYRAYASGKQVVLLNPDGEAVGEPLAHPSSIGGLAFSPNGKRLAASHYDGASLWWVNAKDRSPVKLVWKGSHLGLIWHPDGKILLTSLQESALHGWRLADHAEMQMQGYAAKVHSMGFTAKGKYLATSGAAEVICWPFFGGGPWGKTPLTLGGGEGRLVTRVATHPKDDVVAAGYDDGMIVLAPLDGRVEMLIHAPVAPRKAAVTGLVWNDAGDCLFASLESGYVMLFTVESVRKSLAHV